MSGPDGMYLHLSSHTTSNYRTYTVVACSLEASCWKGLLLARQRKVYISWQQEGEV